MSATIALVDVNNFYVSCELLFNPKLRGRPVVVLSNNDGCIVSRSGEAKRLGIKMGMPWFEARVRYKDHGVAALSSNYALYADMSNRVMSVLAEFASAAEVYSIDEAFLDFSGLSAKTAAEYGARIRQTVLQWTGLPVCVGLGSTKTLAKLANHYAKTQPQYHGVFDLSTLPARAGDAVLQSLPAGDVWGIGTPLAAKLKLLGIDTALDLKQAHPGLLRDRFGVVMARTIAELNGVSCIGLEQISPPRQNVSTSRTFGVPVTSLPSLSEAVVFYTARAAEKARRQEALASALSVYIKTSGFEPRPYSSGCQTLALPVPTSDSRQLAKLSLTILRHIYRPGFRYQKAGVILSGLVPVSEGVTRDLFNGDDDQYRQSQKLMAVFDHINSRFGRQTLKLAGEGFKAPWQMKQAFKSPSYTTCWEHLLQVE
ncbi:MAG: DNA polymerase V subunit UmuC [Methylobacter sp.]|nr:MAG: DNA polymerase V subunit UmuC [Methylobacter sp.]